MIVVASFAMLLSFQVFSMVPEEQDLNNQGKGESHRLKGGTIGMRENSCIQSCGEAVEVN